MEYKTIKEITNDSKERIGRVIYRNKIFPFTGAKFYLEVEEKKTGHKHRKLIAKCAFLKRYSFTGFESMQSISINSLHFTEKGLESYILHEIWNRSPVSFTKKLMSEEKIIFQKKNIG